MGKQTLSLAVVLVAMITTPVRAQTGQPVQQMLPDPRVGDAQTAPLELAPGTLACRLNLIRLWVDIPPWAEARHWLIDLIRRDEPIPAEAAARLRCLEVLDEPLVRFDGDLPPTPPPVW